MHCWQPSCYLHSFCYIFCKYNQQFFRFQFKIKINKSSLAIGSKQRIQNKSKLFSLFFSFNSNQNINSIILNLSSCLEEYFVRITQKRLMSSCTQTQYINGLNDANQVFKIILHNKLAPRRHCRRQGQLLTRLEKVTFQMHLLMVRAN